MTHTMSHVDHFWLSMDEPTNFMVITGLMEFEKPLAYEQLEETVETRLLCHNRFKMCVNRPLPGMGSPTWEPARHFNIRNHLHRMALPAPGDKQILQETISHLATIPLDDRKPLWEMYLLENYRGGTALFAKIHHCIADGIALIQVLLSATDTDAVHDAKEREESPQPEAKHERKRQSTWQALTRKVDWLRGATEQAGTTALSLGLQTLKNPFHLVGLARSAVHTGTDIVSVLSKLALMPPDPNTAFKGRVGTRKHMVWTDPIPLENVKIVGRAIDTATLNDVLIATVTGAMRHYLKNTTTRINELKLHVTVPVNIRRPGTELNLGNHFSLVFLALPIHLEDPVLRLKEIKRQMDKLKTGPDAMVGFGFLNSIGFFPSQLAKQVAQTFSDKASGVLTNVPGPRQPLYFGGRRIRTMMFWVPRIGKMGLGISIFSYAGTVTIGVAADDKLLPDPQKLLAGFEAEFSRILALVQSGKINEDPLVLHDRFEENRCRAVTQKGDPCKRRALAGSPYCRQHQASSLDSSPETPARCEATTRKGRRCKNRPRPGSRFCKVHTG